MGKRKKNKNQITFVRKVELRMDEEASACLDGQSRILNKLYNTLKADADRLLQVFARAKTMGHEKTARSIAETLYTERGFRNLIPELREEMEYLNRVHSSPLKNVALRLSRAIRAHQDSKYGRRAGPLVAWPRFSAWKRNWMSLEYDEAGKGWKLVDGSKLHISFGKKDGKRLGIIATLVNPPAGLSGAKCLRIIKEHKKFYAIFTVVKNKRKPRTPRVDRIAYIDPNSSNMGVLVDTLGRSVQINNIPGIAALDRRIDEVKKKRDKKKRNSRLVKYQRDDGSMHRHYEPSNRWKTLDKSLKRLEHRRREAIKQVLDSTAHALFDNYDVVGIGNWAPGNGDSGLGRKANRTLRGNRYLGRFRRTLLWVALKRRKLAFVLDEKGTTRTCSACGYVHEEGLAPSIRKWECPECHLVHGRDENAATNGLKKLLLRLEQEESLLPCSGLCPPSIRERSTWSAHPGTPRRRKRLRGSRKGEHEILISRHGIKGSARTCGHDQGIMMPVSIPPTQITAAVKHV